MTHLGLLEENPPRIGSTMVFYFYPDFPARGGEDSDLPPVRATFPRHRRLLPLTVQGE